MKRTNILNNNFNELINRFSYIQSLKKNYEGYLYLLDFGIGESNQFVSDLYNKHLHYQNDEDFSYTDNDDKGFIDAAQKYLFTHYYLSVDKKQIAYTLGTKTTLNILADMLIDKGDVVYTISPSYVVFERAAKRKGARIIHLPLLEKNNFEINLDELNEDDLKQCSVFLINYPHNPTGTVFEVQFLNKLIILAEKYDFFIINDAAYMDIAYESFFPIIKYNKDFSHVIELFTLSKGYNATGLRLGFLVSSFSIRDKFYLFREQYDSGAFKPCLDFGKILLEDRNFQYLILRTYTERKNKIRDCLKTIGFKFKNIKGGFYYYIKVPKKIDDQEFKDAKSFAKYLLDSLGIVVIPYDIMEDHYFRLSLTIKGEINEIITELFDRFENKVISY